MGPGSELISECDLPISPIRGNHRRLKAIGRKPVSLIPAPQGYVDWLTDFKGFSPHNLKYMQMFAGAGPDGLIVQEVLAQLICG